MPRYGWLLAVIAVSWGTATAAQESSGRGLHPDASADVPHAPIEIDPLERIRAARQRLAERARTDDQTVIEKRRRRLQALKEAIRRGEHAGRVKLTDIVEATQAEISPSTRADQEEAALKAYRRANEQRREKLKKTREAVERAKAEGRPLPPRPPPPLTVAQARKLIRETPPLPGDRRAVASMLLRRGHHAAAREIYLTMIMEREQAEDPWVRFALGQCCEGLNQRTAARSHYEAALFLAKRSGQTGLAKHLEASLRLLAK